MKLATGLRVNTMCLRKKAKTYQFRNETYSGPAINATTFAPGAVSTLQSGQSTNQTAAYTFKGLAQGITSDGVPFLVSDDGLASPGNSDDTFDQQVREVPSERGASWICADERNLLDLADRWRVRLSGNFQDLVLWNSE